MAWIRTAALEDEDRLDRKDAGRLLRRTARMCRPFIGEIILGVALMVVHVLCLVAGPYLFQYAIDTGMQHHDGAALDIAAAGMLACAVIALLCARAYLLIVTRTGEKFLRGLRVKVFDHLLGMSLGFFDTAQTGQLVSRMTSDVDSLSDLVQLGLVQFALNGLLFLVTVIALLILSPLLAVVCLVAVPPVVIASSWFRRRSNAAYLLVRDRIGQMLATLQEGLTGVRVVQAFSREEAQIRRFGASNDAQLAANMAATRLSSIYFPFIEGSGVLTTAAVLGVGGYLVHRGSVQVGVVAAFVLYLTNLFEPISQLSQLFNLVQSAGAALTKLFGLLDTPSPVVERRGAVDLPADGRVEVRDVAFAYGEGEPVLSGVDLTVADGERLALVGPTGAGKSTLAKLVSRFYDPTSGSIRVGGVDLRDATLGSVHRRIVVVPQEGHLFGGSIADNVRLGRWSATDADVAEALAAIGALDRFASLPEGLGTDVREGGSRLSAGERQLVSLARAFLSDPRVLILDEATSNLDPGTEIEVERALEAVMRGRTVIIVAHRLSTAERSDRVAVVAAGGIAEVGTHRELVARGERYARLFESWTGGLAAAG
ncbi:MAG: ABC transporter ATP-binding protein [Acidimicrobiales bacterium]